MTTWEKIKLKNLLTLPIQNGYSPICPKTPTGRWIIGLGALTGNGIDLSQVKPAPANDSKVDRYFLSPGDFLVSRSNTLDKVGRSALFKGQIKNCSYSDLMMRFRINQKIIQPEYLEIYLKSIKTIRYFQRMASGTSGSMVKINKNVLENLSISIPPISYQKTIVKLIGAWDKAIGVTYRLIVAKEKRLHFLFQKFFKPNSAANEIWVKRKIGEFLIPRKEKAIPTEKIPLFSLTIEDGVTEKTDRYNREYLVSDTRAKTYKIVHPGDIVFNPANLRWGAIARSEVTHKVVISPIYEVLSIRKNKIDSDFMTHALTCPRQISVYATKTEGSLIERMAVKLDAFLLLEILVPTTFEEQVKVKDVLNTAKKEINLHKTQLLALQKQKRGLMQKLLSGNWSVKV